MHKYEKVHIEGRRLGKLAPKHNDKILKFHDFLAPAPLGPHPVSISWQAATNIPNWPMYANDKYGDCTCAGMGHMIECWTAWTQSKPILFTDTQVLAEYTRVTGEEGAAFDPKTGANDNGCALSDCIVDWTKNGFANTGHKILGAVSINTYNLFNVKWGAVLFGGLYCGVQLPLSVQNATTVWDVPKGGPHGNGAPGSWGGHCVPVIGFDSTYIYVVTWGQIMKVTNAFWKTYFDEAYAVYTPDWEKVGGSTPVGIDFVTLKAELANVNS